METIGRSVAEGCLRNQDAYAATRAVREWLKAHEAGRVAERVEEN